MSFTPNIPASGQSLGSSRPQIVNNFSIIRAAFALNHVDFNDSAFGRHKFLQMPEQGSAPATGVNEGGVYTKDAGGFTNLFWKQESGGATPNKNQGESIQMTNITPSNTATGRSFLPGGMLIQWGQVSLVGSTTLVTFNESFDINPYTIQLTWANSAPASITISVSASSVTNTGFDITCNPGVSGPSVYYLAIGKRET